MSYLRHSDHGLFVQGALWQFWTGGAGWLGQLYYDYYLFTGDRGFLANRAVPFLKEVAVFYEDFLTEGHDGKLMFSPSMSPENRPANTGSRTSVNATMDIAIAKEVLRNLISTCNELGIEQEGTHRWRGMLGKLPDYRLEPSGKLKEWLHPDLENNDSHRHLSHLYPVFPGSEIDSEKGDASLREAARTVLTEKLQSEYHRLKDRRPTFGWSFAHLANAFARLGEGEKALSSLRGVAGICSEKNLLSFFDPPDGPFQIDGNCGFSSAVMEMLLGSQPGVLKLLPALPASWSKGKVEGLQSRAGVQVGILWDAQASRIEVTLKSKKKQEIRVRFPASIIELSAEGIRLPDVSPPGTPRYRSIRLPAGEEVTLRARLTKDEFGSN